MRTVVMQIPDNILSLNDEEFIKQSLHIFTHAKDALLVNGCREDIQRGYCNGKSVNLYAVETD